MPEKYRVAIIGLGRIGSLLEQDDLRQQPSTHLGAWLAHPDRCEIVGVSDINRATFYDTETNSLPQVLKNKFWNFNGTWKFPFYEDYQDMLTKVKADIVSIATPDEAHKKIARDAMGYQNVKLIFLEKPIALTLDDADAIISRAREFKVKLAINHTRRWSPIWQYVAKLCLEEQPITMKSIMTGGSGGIRDQIHMADLYNWFMPKQPAYALEQKDNPPYLTFEVDLFWKDKRIRISENGRLSEMYQSFPSKNYSGIQELEKTCDIRRNSYPYTDMYLAAQQLLDALDRDEEPLCTGLHGKRALETWLTWQK